jgi:hypothetical protein
MRFQPSLTPQRAPLNATSTATERAPQENYYGSLIAPPSAVCEEFLRSCGLLLQTLISLG